MPIYARLKNADSIEVDNIRSVAGAAPTFPEGLKTDTISEETAAAGVTIDGVLLKDGAVIVASFSTDLISEKTPAAGVTIDGVLIKDGSVTAATSGGTLTAGSGGVVSDVIAEKTGAAGVTIDGVLLKDAAVNSATFQNSSGAVALTAGSGTATVSGSTGVVLTSAADLVTIKSTGVGATATWAFNGKDLLPAVTLDAQIGNSSFRVERINGEFINLAINSLVCSGTTQGDAAAITRSVTYLTGANLSGAILPAGTVGDIYFVKSIQSSANLNVYPPSGGTIENGSVDIPMALSAQRAAILHCYSSGNYKILGYKS